MWKNVDDVSDDVILYEKPKKSSKGFKTHFTVKKRCKELETFPKYVFY